MKTDTSAEWILRFVLFVIAVPSLHFGLGLPIWLALVIGAVLALLGVFLIVIVLDGDGSPW